MDTTNQHPAQFILRFERFIALTWVRLRNPLMTGVLLVLLVIILLLPLLIPQQLAFGTTAAAWTPTLPWWLQPWGQLLFFLGFSRIFWSLWFWIPLALLLFHSLIAVVDYARPSWQRAQAARDIATIEWQHPLSQRVEYSVRLPASPDEFLDGLKERLVTKGFTVDAPFVDVSFVDEGRVVSAARWRRGWLGVLTFYSGLLLLSIAFLLGYYYLNAESLTLSPLKPQKSKMVNGTLELVEIDAARRSGVVTFTPQGDGQSSKAVSWQMPMPTFFNAVLLWPAAIEPIVTVEVQNTTGELETLIPLQEDLPPATRLNLPLSQVDGPFYFLIPSTSLAFQISPAPASGQDRYNVQVRRGTETSPSENLMINLGETFEVDSFLVTVSPNHNLKFVARRDWGLLLYFALSIIVIVASAVWLALFPPQQLWLIPEVKGRGGQLYGVVEKFGFAKGASEFLEQLLVQETLLEDQETQE